MASAVRLRLLRGEISPRGGGEIAISPRGGGEIARSRPEEADLPLTFLFAGRCYAFDAKHPEGETVKQGVYCRRADLFHEVCTRYAHTW